MTFPIDPLKLYSRTVIFHNTRRVIQIEASDIKSIFLDILCFDIRMFKVPYIIKPDLQRKSGPRCLLLPVQPRWQSCRDVVWYFLHEDIFHGKLQKNMQRLLRDVHPYEGTIQWGIPICYVDQCLHYCLRHARWILLKYHLVHEGDKMIWQLCDKSFEVAFGKQFTISVDRGFCRCPCPLHARELLTGTYCIQDVSRHVNFYLLTFGQLPSSCDLFVQPVGPHVRPVTCFSFTGQLVQRNHPTLWEGLRALLPYKRHAKMTKYWYAFRIIIFL